MNAGPDTTDRGTDLILPNLGRARFSKLTPSIAVGLAALLSVIALAANVLNGIPTARWDAFLPIVITIWFVAQSLTALLLFGQYFITRACGFLIYACAYELAALLLIPYLASVPGVVPGIGIDPANRQMPGALWTTWHLAFPLMLMLGLAIDPRLNRRLPARLRARTILAIAIVGTFAIAVLLVAAVWSVRYGIPTIVLDGHTTMFYRTRLVPAVAIANGAVCIFAISRGRNVVLGSWLALATFAATLDAIVNGNSGHTWSFAWYLAKGATTLTATGVLAMLVVEIAALYRRLAHLATRDALTGLSNRRGLEEYANWAFGYARRRDLSIGMLVVDIDHFKRYNDRYGHVAGDRALRRVADVVRDSTLRGYDLAARFGGEEFVLIVVDVSMPQLVTIARRLQERLEIERIAHSAVESGLLSVSIGIAHGTHLTLAELFATADRALFEAKDRGRDRYVVGNALADPPPVVTSR